ncbi:hypothetical protein DAPPUDRAFT_105507 [Daphnia pulex]|uniref:NACHT domain-containing protein n=1 Tax=Daphnia pulex TaxID=6669 RepID=E9GQ37_DAPPU|nr:hypothetical protein DAPPUDRAFT_105507 [Daphnia pulex]|eukprot:EFX78240.1 hypothetical protein DAPPUDRAFT_105507 [Daphnia pulex]
MDPSKNPKRPSNDDATSASKTSTPQSKNEIQFKKLSLNEEIISKCDKKLLKAASFKYQKQSNEQCEFNDEAIQEMAENLNQLLTSPNKIERIATKLPKRTAAKVIAALEKFRLEQPIASDKVQKKCYQRKDSYLMTSFSSLQESAFKNILTNNNFYCQLLVAVCEGEGHNCSLCASTKDDDYYRSKITNKIIIINHCEDAGAFDDLKFTELSERFKKILLSKKILFQGTLQTVESLIQQSGKAGCSPANVIDLDSMEELIQIESIEIPSPTSSSFEKSFYIPRRLTRSTFPFSDNFWSQVDKEMGHSVAEQLKTKCKVNSNGEIQWFVAHDKKSKIWEEMISLLEKINSPISPSESRSSISEDDLLFDWNLQNKLPGVVIISGVAGTGKSSILSHYYEQIKNKDPGHWVILINLSDHSEAFSKLDYRSIDKLTVVHFLINLSVVTGQSKFARLLLKHRLETGDRIVVMLDGFDESHYKDNVILVINTLKQMKSVGLYVTTRSHTAGYLQLQLSQLAYNLDDFSKENQINYLTSLWKRELGDENVQLFATSSLVDQMAKSLKDKEMVFIGIPLHCRILAECYKSQVQRTNNQQEFDLLLKEINRLNLKLPNLYRLIVKNKQQIYIDARENSDSSIDNQVKTLQQFLRDLAIKTIVSGQDDVNLLLGNSAANTLLKLGHDYIRFGLLETNAEGKAQFSHRTYAEYYIAEHLYKWLLLDDDKEKSLPIVEKNAREFIRVNIILTKNHYAGVLVFFDSMLKEIDNENIKWREIIDKKREIPLRFKIFTKLWKSTKNAQEILLNAIKNRNVNIFKFLFDCFDVTFDSAEFRKVMRPAIHAPNFQIFENFTGENSSETFKRFIKHYDIAADKSEVNKIFSAIQRELPHTKFRDWDNKEEKRKIVDLVLDFLLKHKESLKHIETEKRPEEILLHVRALHFFMCNNYYANQLKKWLELLSHLYDDESFAKLFLKTERQARLDCQNSPVNIRPTLTILRDIGRNGLLERICRLVLLWDYQTYESFYLVSTGQSHPLLRLTRLQQAAFNGATPTVMEIIEEEPETSKGELLGNTSEENEAINVGKSIEEIMDDDMVRNDQSFTPLYLAAAQGHKEVCRKLMVLLKNDWLEGVFGALRDAVYVRKIEMFELILRTVKEEMGQDYLLKLLKSKYPGGNTNYDLYWAAIILDGGDNDKKLWYRKVADIIVHEGEGNEQHWDDLNDFVLRDQHSIKSLEYVDPDTAKKMIMARGFKNWIQRLLDIHISEGFYFLFQKYEDKLTGCMGLFDESRLSSDFLVIFTSSKDGEGNHKTSHWARILQTDYVPEKFERINYSSNNLLNSFMNYLELIFAELSQGEINERLFDDEGIVAITRSLLKHGRKSLVNWMLDYIAVGNKTDIKQHLLVKLIKEIKNIIAPVTEEAKSQWILYGHVNIIWTRIKILVFIMDNANYSTNLSELVCAILEQHCNKINETGCSIWSCYFDNVDGRSEEMALNKMDNFLKYVMDTSGESDVRKLVQGNIFNALTHWNDSRLNVLLHQLMSDEKQTKEIGRQIVKEALEMMNELSFCARVCYWKNIQQFVDYADSGELTKLTQIITQKYQIKYDDKENSVWSSYLHDEYFYTMESVSYVNEILPRNVNKFLKNVSEKLGQTKVKQLVFHEQNDLYGDKITAIQFAKSERNYSLVNALLTHLKKEN